MPDDMSRESLPLGQVPALGATHAEHVGFHQPTWTEQNPLESTLKLVQMGGRQHAELSPTVGVSFGPNESEIKIELQRYGDNWNTKPEADKDKFFPAWEMVLKARLGSKVAEKWCQDNKLSLELHGEVFRRLAAKRRKEKMTTAERSQGLTGEFLIFREALPHLLEDKELVGQRVPQVPQQGGQNAAKS